MVGDQVNAVEEMQFKILVKGRDAESVRHKAQSYDLTNKVLSGNVDMDGE